MIRSLTVMLAPLVLRNFAPRVERPGGFFTSLGLGFHALAHGSTFGFVGAASTWFKRSFFACGFGGSFGGGLGHHHFSVHHGDSPVGVNGASRFLQLSFWVELQTVSPQLCQRVSHALLQHTQQG